VVCEWLVVDGRDVAREANAKRISYRSPRSIEALLFEWQAIACIDAGTLLLRRANRNSRSGNSRPYCALRVATVIPIGRPYLPCCRHALPMNIQYCADSESQQSQYEQQAVRRFARWRCYSNGRERTHRCCSPQTTSTIVTAACDQQSCLGLLGYIEARETAAE